MAHLVIVEGPNSGKTYPLLSDNTIGSAPENTIPLKDRRVGSYLLKIKRYPRGYMLTLLIPGKSVKVNGEKVRKTYLHHGDIITVAGTLLLYIEEKEEFGDLGRSAVFPIVDFEDYSSTSLASIKIPDLSAKTPVFESGILQCINPNDYRSQVFQCAQSDPQLSALLKVCTAISEIQDIDLLLDRILTIVFKAFPASRGFVFLIGPNNRLERKAFRQRAKQQQGSMEYSKQITRRVLTQKMSLLYNSPTPSRDAASPLSCLSVPLNCKGKLLGLIQLEAFGNHKFTDAELEHLCQIALPTAVAIENLYTYQQSAHYRRHLIALGRFSQSLSSLLDKNSIMREAIHAATHLFNSQRVSILLVDEQQRHLVLAYAQGIPNEEWSDTSIPIVGTVAGKVFTKNKPLLISNTRQIPLLLRQSSKQGNYHTDSCILAPIQVTAYQSTIQKKAIGVICVTDKQDRSTFSKLERNLLALLANQIGTALTNAQLYEKATTDPLTKIYTRAYFLQCMQEEIHNARRNSTPLSLLMFDLDHFKAVNDTYTHQSGDLILREMGGLLREIANQQQSLVGRYGGEEFMMLLYLDHDQAMAQAEQIRKTIAGHTFSLVPQGKIYMTTSIGIATLRDTDVSKLLIERADQALYIAKRKNRNCVISEKEILRHDRSAILEKAKLI